ncbi:hypothetical protein ACOTVS_10075 [Aliarcobacter butzleri]|uniref:hypothetical protein n=1 Tax=Aliarcobacter butzleri TaxID=28197 RepID=UPI00344D082F
MKELLFITILVLLFICVALIVLSLIVLIYTKTQLSRLIKINKKYSQVNKL